ncbi:MAG: hypothetical protein ACFE0Q_15700 [Anaerolineae bacterium]
MADLSLCSYEALADGSYAFTLHDSSRDAVQALAHHIEQLQLARKWYGKDHVRLLIDARQASTLPIRYLFEVLNDYNRPYPHLDPPKLTMAYLRNPETVILDMYHMLAELFNPPMSVQYFMDAERAKSWLLESN